MFRLARSFCKLAQAEPLLTGAKGQLEKLTVFKKAQISPDSYMLLLGYDKDKILGVPRGRHLRIHFPDDLANGRTFTPLNVIEEHGVCKLLVKVYRPNAEFPNGGKMSQYLETVKPGDHLTVSGPRGKIEYLGDGNFYFHNVQTKRKFTRVSYIAGGSGITPIFQLLVNRSAADKIPVTLIYANKTEEDILLKNEIDSISAESDLLSVTYTVEKPSAQWKGVVGRVEESLLKNVLKNPCDAHVVFICGPKLMNESVKQHLLSLGYPEDNIIFY